MRNYQFQAGGKEAMFDAISKSFPTAPQLSKKDGFEKRQTTKELPKETEKLPVSQPPTPLSNMPMTNNEYEQQFAEQLPELDQLRSDEGFRTTVYKDTLGNLTVGTGHKLTPKELLKYQEGDEFDPDDLEEILQKDYQTARKGAERIAPDNAPEEVKNILTNMVFQMGEAGVGNFKNMKAALKEGDYAKASEEMLDSLWAKQTPERANRLAERMASLSLLAENVE